MTVLEQLEGQIQKAAQQTGPAVVGLGRGWGVGSGVVIASGRVLTNAHNLRHGEVTVTFADGRRETGRVAGSDADLDLAVIEVDTGDAEAINWSDDNAESVEIGRSVVALANPGGRGLRVTPGFVSSTARSFRGPRGRRIRGAIEHTAPLPRGSSGGPLVDAAGRLLGINTVRVDGGLILAIAADAALRERIEALGRGEPPKRDGVLVRAVEDDGAAARAGLQRGDLIVIAGGREIDTVEALYEALDGAGAAGQIELTVVRGTDEQTITVTF
jgi:serine protease Do